MAELEVAGRPAPRGDGRIRPPTKVALLLGLIVLAGFGVRIHALSTSAPDVPALSDAGAYHQLGANLADGRGYVRPYDLSLDGRVEPTAEYPPGLPAALAVADTLGVDGEAGQRALLCGVGALTVGLVGLIGRRLGGDATGFLASGIAALHPAMWNVDVSLMPEPLAAFGGAGLVLATLAVHDHPTRGRGAALALGAGLACFLRAEFLLLGPLLLAGLAWRHGGGWRRRAGLLTVGLGLVAAVLAPWTLRNWVTFDRFVPVSNNLGSALRGANCDLAYRGPYTGLWVTNVGEGDGSEVDPAGRCFEGFTLSPGVDEADDAARQRAEGLAYARSHVGELPRVVAARLGRTVGLYQLDQQSNFAAVEGRDPAWDRRGTRTFQALAVIGAAGLAAGGRRRRERWLLLAPPLALAVTVAATYGNPRFRAVAEPVVVVLAALALVDAARALATRSSSGPSPAEPSDPAGS